MIPATGSRLAIVAVLLALQTTIFVLELLISFVTARRYQSIRQWFSPGLITLLGVVLASATFSNLDTGIERTGSDCTTSIDADIAGDGVRSATYMQVGVLLIISLVASFHSKATGAKEIGAGLVITHLSLGIALLVRVARGTLNSADAATGVMILDAQNIALSIQLAAKETLASRWQVHVVVMVQIFGLVTIPILVSGLHDGSFIIDECRCLTFFWWAWLGNCMPVHSSYELVVFWIYFACRLVGFSQTSFHSLYNTWRFHQAEKACRKVESPDTVLGGILLNITYSHYNKHADASYRDYPATVTIMFLFYGIFALTSLVAAEMTIRDLNLHPSSAIDSVGQVIALVIASATVIRALWLFVRLFHKEKGHGFVWPFRRRPFVLSDEQYHSIAPYDPDLPEESVPLGYVLKAVDDLNTKFDTRVTGLATMDKYSLKDERNVIRIDTLPLNGLVPQICFELNINREIRIRSFDYKKIDMRRYFEVPEIQNYLKKNKRSKVYIVYKAAHEVRYSFSYSYIVSSEGPVSVGGEASRDRTWIVSRPGLPRMGLFDFYPNMSFSVPRKVMYGYSVVKIGMDETGKILMSPEGGE